MLNRILVSRCFLGAPVRYNNIVKPLMHPLLALWQKQGRVYGFCPEVSGGLTTPRPAAEIQASGRILTQQGQDVSQQFLHGAELALAFCQQHKINFALLKESSPSCGSKTIYNGHFEGVKIAGQGVTTQLLRQHNIQVFSEDNIELLAQALSQCE